MFRPPARRRFRPTRSMIAVAPVAHVAAVERKAGIAGRAVAQDDRALVVHPPLHLGTGHAGRIVARYRLRLGGQKREAEGKQYCFHGGSSFRGRTRAWPRRLQPTHRPRNGPVSAAFRQNLCSRILRTGITRRPHGLGDLLQLAEPPVGEAPVERQAGIARRPPLQNGPHRLCGVGLMGHVMAKNVVEKGMPLTAAAQAIASRSTVLVRLGARKAAQPGGPCRGERYRRHLRHRSPRSKRCSTGADRTRGSRHGTDCVRLLHGRSLIDRPTGGQDLRRAPSRLSTRPCLALQDAGSGSCDVAWRGGDDLVFERVRPGLKIFAGRIVRTGPVGSGHTMKLLNNLFRSAMRRSIRSRWRSGQRSASGRKSFDSGIRDGRMDCRSIGPSSPGCSNAIPTRTASHDRADFVAGPARRDVA